MCWALGLSPIISYYFIVIRRVVKAAAASWFGECEGKFRERGREREREETK